ncbi:hypothetical protein PybrP1_005685 [[Pythium] brassicae (nom. inval.)]|nr:hypothetical protein PybrP1_005685 [[Pythium] brassicae (nom. inval.)]
MRGAGSWKITVTRQTFKHNHVTSNETADSYFGISKLLEDAPVTSEVARLVST